MRIVFLISALTFCLNVFSQNKEYAKSVIDTLSHPVMAGRAYQHEGANKAAEYIKNEFIKNSALSFENNYFQTFNHNVASVTHFKINDGQIKIGDDAVVTIRSASASGEFKVAILDSATYNNEKKFKKFLKKNIEKKFIAIHHQLINSNPENRQNLNRLANSNLNNAKGFILTTEKQPIFDANVSRGFLYYPLITMTEASFKTLKNKKIKLELETIKQEKYELKNIVAYVPGSLYPDSFVVFTAHYDHLGMLGKDVYYPGANDNASGVAYLLDLAAYYSANPADYSIAFIACAAEEVGLLGSFYFAENPLFPLENIKFLINLDMVGTGANGIHIVNATELPEQYEKFVEINEKHNLVKNIGKGGKSCNSDHCPFVLKSVPAFFIFTRDENHRYYHVPQDKADIIPLTAYNELFELMKIFIEEL